MKPRLWTDPNLDLPAKAAACFLGTPRLRRLMAGTDIYRLRTNEVGAAEEDQSPWWFPQETFHRIVQTVRPGSHGITKAARAGLAVPPRFNPDLDSLVICRLVRSGYCWEGPARAQTWRTTGGLLLLGGFVQLWIPHLSPADYRFQFCGSVTDRM